MKSKPPLLLTLDLEHCASDVLVGLLKNPATDASTLDRIAVHHHRNEGLMDMVLSHPRVMPQTLLFLFNTASAGFKKRMHLLKKEPLPGDGKAVVPFNDPGREEASGKKGGEADPQELEKRSLFQRIQKMTVAEKVQFALRAGKDARSLLLKDPNRQVSQAVLDSPKITEDEILFIAQSRNVSDDILRAVGKNKEWLKNYSVVFALVSNPKTPLGISMPLLSLIKVKDLGILAKNRNVPEAIRSGAARLVQARQKSS
ncbi:MAG: hypothetical protein HY349_01270 [Nitrospirae bacterium]|nr:hypothetical protein [Nitrospirota bacterium]